MPLWAPRSPVLAYPLRKPLRELQMTTKSAQNAGVPDGTPLAGLPSPVLDPAAEVLAGREADRPLSPVAAAELQIQLPLALAHPVMVELEELNLDGMTPLEALQLAGFNTVWFDYQTPPALVEEAVGRGFWVVPALPVTGHDVRLASATGIADQVMRGRAAGEDAFRQLRNILARHRHVAVLHDSLGRVTILETRPVPMVDAQRVPHQQLGDGGARCGHIAGREAGTVPWEERR